MRAAAATAVAHLTPPRPSSSAAAAGAALTSARGAICRREAERARTHARARALSRNPQPLDGAAVPAAAESAGGANTRTDGIDTAATDDEGEEGEEEEEESSRWASKPSFPT